MASMFMPKTPTPLIPQAPQPLPDMKVPETPAPRVPTPRVMRENPVAAGILALSNARRRTGRRSTILSDDGGNSMGSSGKTLGA
jgi:hypothetical protein